MKKGNGNALNSSGEGFSGSGSNGSNSGNALSVLDSFFVSVENSFEKVLSHVDAAAVVAAKFINENLETLPDQPQVTRSLVSPPQSDSSGRSLKVNTVLPGGQR